MCYNQSVSNETTNGGKPMNLLNAYPQLKENIIFKNASDEKILEYITDKDFYFKDFASDAEIISPDIEDNPIGIMISGRASIVSADGSRRVLLRTISHGAVFGISTLYAKDSGFPTKITAKRPSRILFIRPDALRSLIENDRGAMTGYMTFLSNKIIAFTAGSAERRLSLFLADNEIDGVYSADISATALSDMLDIGRASLYRAFDRLEAAGFIERRDKSIIIKDKQAMLEKYHG